MRQKRNVSVCYDNFMIIKEDIRPGERRSTLLLDPKTEALVRKYLPDDGAVGDLAALFAAFADPGRLRIVSALSVTEMCVGDLSSVLDVNQTTLSHQLRFLKNADVVTYKKQGKTVFYSLTSSIVSELMLNAAKLGGRND